MSFRDIHHQDRAVRSIQRALSNQRLAHALIFHGPEGVGRELTAHALAQTLLCAAPQSTIDNRQSTISSDACGHCSDCRLVRAGTHPDLNLIYRQLKDIHPDSDIRKRKGQNLSIEVVREFLVKRVGNKPVRGRFKVFIVREAELLDDSQNALLKTLEEPPPATHIILITTSRDRLFPTIQSRCQPIPFQLLPTHFVAAQLIERRPALNPQDADTLARFAQGSLGLALQYADDGLHQLSARLIPSLHSLDRRQALPFAKSLLDEAVNLGKMYQERDEEITDTEAQRRGVKVLLLILAAEFRDALKPGIPSGAPHSHAARQPGPGRAPSDGSPGRAIEVINQLSTTERILDLNANVHLTLDALAIHLAR